MTDLLAYAQKHTELKKTSSSGGGEYSGPCPVCGGKDRFSVQPNSSKGARWFCRGCGEGRWHDVYDLVQAVDNVDFKGAKRLLGEPVQASQVEILDGKSANRLAHFDRDVWEKAATRFIDACEYELFAKKGKKALDWLHDDRGLKDDTLRFWGVGFNPIERYDNPAAWGWTGNDGKVYIPRGITIPYYPDHMYGVNLRCKKPYRNKYHMLRGSERYLFGVETTLAPSDIMFLFEGEFDVMLAWQECKGLSIAVASMPAQGLFKKEWAVWMTKIKHIIICFDNDHEGQNGARRLKEQMGVMAHIAQIPHGKDLSEYHEQGGNVFEFAFNALELTTG